MPAGGAAACEELDLRQASQREHHSGRTVHPLDAPLPEHGLKVVVVRGIPGRRVAPVAGANRLLESDYAGASQVARGRGRKSDGARPTLLVR